MEKVYENKLGEFRHRRLPFAYWNEGPPTDAVSLSCCTRYQALPALQDLTVKWDTAMTIVSFYAMWKDRGIHKVLREREIGSDDSDLVVLGCGFRSEKVRGYVSWCWRMSRSFWKGCLGKGIPDRGKHKSKWTVAGKFTVYEKESKCCGHVEGDCEVMEGVRG